MRRAKEICCICFRDGPPIASFCTVGSAPSGTGQSRERSALANAKCLKRIASRFLQAILGTKEVSFRERWLSGREIRRKVVIRSIMNSTGIGIGRGLGTFGTVIEEEGKGEFTRRETLAKCLVKTRPPRLSPRDNAGNGKRVREKARIASHHVVSRIASIDSRSNSERAASRRSALIGNGGVAMKESRHGAPAMFNRADCTRKEYRSHGVLMRSSSALPRRGFARDNRSNGAVGPSWSWRSHARIVAR